MEGLLQRLVTIVFYHKGSHLRVELTEDGDIAVAHLIEYGDYRAFTECGIVSGLKGTYIGYVTVVTNGVVVDIVSHLLYKTVIAYRDITECRVVDTGMFKEASADLHLLVELTKADVAIEHNTVKIIRFKTFCHQYTLPVFCPAHIVFENVNLCLSQVPVFTHSLDIKNRYMDISVRGALSHVCTDAPAVHQCFPSVSLI